MSAKKIPQRFIPKTRDVFDALYPFYLFCRIMGVINFKIKTFYERRRYSVDIFESTRQISQLALIMFLTYLHIKDEIIEGVFENKFSEMVLYIEEAAGAILSIGGTVIGIIFAKRIVSILNGIYKIDMEFKKLSITPVDWQVWYFSVISVVLCCASITILVVSDIINRETESFALYDFLITTVSLIPSLINMVVQFQYSNYALIIRSRYAALNRYLETILEEGVGVKINVRNALDILSLKLAMAAKRISQKFIPKIGDVFDALYPFYLFCRILGTINFKITTSYDRKQYSVDSLELIRQIVQLSLVVFLVYLDIKGEFVKDVFMSKFSDMVLHIEEVATAVLTIGGTIIGITYAKKVVSILNGIHKIDLELKKLNIIPVDWQVWYFSIISVALCCTSITVLMVFDTPYIEADFTFLSYEFLIATAGLIPSLINMVVQFQYSNYALIIRSRYEALNRYLETILEGVAGVKINVWISEDLQPSDPKKQGKVVKTSAERIFIVDTVASYHIKLADIATILNRAFCVQLLLLITTSFLGIVTALFLIAINFKQPIGDDSSGYNFVFTAWAFSNTIALLVVVHTTCSLCDEANKCPRILHKIRNNTNDSKLHTTIEMYSLQMYHNRLQFHVCGLFPLDYTLLYTIVAGVTTHLVILIQFNSGDYGKRALNDTILLNYTSLQ